MKLRGLLLAMVLLLGAAGIAGAAVYYSGDNVTLAEGDTLRENLITTGGSVTVYGEVLGDVLSACRNYTQYGTVTDNVFAACRFADINGPAGDLLVFAQTVNVKSDTTGDIRTAAQTVNVYGYVDGDLIAGAESIYVGPDAVITGDIYVGASQVTLLGDVMGDFKGGAEMINIGGTVHGDVEAWTDEVLFTGSGEVLGDLIYHAEEEMEIDFGRHVHGTIDWSRIMEDEDQGGWAGGFLFGLYLLITAIVTAFLLVLVWQVGLEGVLVAMDQKLGGSIVAGLVGFAATPFIAIILMLLVITLPLGVILLFLYPVLLYLGWVVFGIWLGKTLLDGLLKRPVSLWAAAPVGVLIAGILAYVPWIGWIIALLSTILGMGMLIMQLLGLRALRTW